MQTCESNTISSMSKIRLLLICANIQALIEQTKNEDAEKRTLQYALEEIGVRLTLFWQTVSQVYQ